jgi:Peptidase M15
MKLTLKQYLMGYDVRFPLLFTPQIRKNAELMVDLVNALIERASKAGVKFHEHPVKKCVLSSGWRPPEVNAKTRGAATNSKHMTCQAADIYDPEGDLDEWLLTEDGQKAITEIGLWMEHPSATKGWSHVQSIPPGSKRRVFYP